MTTPDEDDSGLFNESEVGDPDAPVLDDQEDKRDYLDELVGDGKKFLDTKALAKGKAVSDDFIQRLQTENSGLRKELNTRLSLEEFLEKTQKPTPDNSNQAEQNLDEGDKQNVQVSQEDIQTLVTKTVTETQQKQLQKLNLDTVRNTLQSQWGKEFPYKLKERSAQLGLGEEFMNNLAATNPKAFYELVGVTTPKVQVDTHITPPLSTVRSVPITSGAQNFEHYTKLRKEKPAEYWSPRIQNEMYEQAKKQGESFYN